ncbi:hypothetical protein F5X96DRAFT_508197 [Biscogniauxia mediterranea]|nr:hypothetical protein F5X96DRAFT_508197 [Biscogniauxia mediterranea]
MPTSLLSHVTDDGAQNLCLTHPETKCALIILGTRAPSQPNGATWVVHNTDLCRCAVNNIGGLSQRALEEQQAEFRSKYRIVSRPSNPEELARIPADGEIDVMARAHGVVYTIAFYKHIFGLPLPNHSSYGDINVFVRISTVNGKTRFTLQDPDDI